MTLPESSEPAPTVVLDCRGMLCPLPIIELGRAFGATVSGQLVELISDDPAAAVDVAAWCRMRGQQLVSSTPHEAASSGKPATTYLVRHTPTDAG
jgi:TusA-related sulfurtransferase